MISYFFTYWEPKNILKCSSCHFMPFEEISLSVRFDITR
jgi:hypothetical protein